MDEHRSQRHNNGSQIRDLTAFFIFGLCNNYGYVVMLTAAVDILSSKGIENEKSWSAGRNCTLISTGAILLADIIPAFVIKLLSPFIPYHTTFRIFTACLTSAISFLLVATAASKWIVILGVIVTSFSSGLGEPTFLYHTTYYDKNTISTWSSGTGAAGVVGALSYSLLRQMGLSSYNTLMLMILVPLIEFTVYKTVLTSPNTISNNNLSDSFIEEVDDNVPLIHREGIFSNTILTFSEKLALLPTLFVYIVPLALVYFFEYFINQGLFELVIFENISLTKEQQYHWYQVMYQIGVFVARSSVNIIQIKQTWIMSFIQGSIAIFFTIEAIYLFVPSIWIIMTIIFIEGLQGGLVYVNTFYRINQDVMPEFKTYSMNIVALSDSFGIIFAGFFAIYAHNFICSL